MNTDWITDILRDLLRFARLNQMDRLARDLEQTLGGLAQDAPATAPSQTPLTAEKLRAELDDPLASPDRAPPH